VAAVLRHLNAATGLRFMHRDLHWDNVMRRKGSRHVQLALFRGASGASNATVTHHSVRLQLRFHSLTWRGGGRAGARGRVVAAEREGRHEESVSVRARDRSDRLRPCPAAAPWLDSHGP
jgi:hypothetical protein